jgi:hypothetical protein
MIKIGLKSIPMDYLHGSELILQIDYLIQMLNGFIILTNTEVILIIINGLLLTSINILKLKKQRYI